MTDRTMFIRLADPICSWDGVAAKKVYIVSRGAESIRILIDPNLDVCLDRGFSHPFYGECWETGDSLYFSNPRGLTVEFDSIHHFDPNVDLRQEGA